MLEEVKTSHQVAKEAVAQGDGTLEEAKQTYDILSGFQSKVAESSANAKLSLETVPDIERQIVNTEETVRNADRVTYHRASALK